MSQIRYVNLSDLVLPEFQAHKKINPEHIEEISESIKKIGIIEPLIIRKTDNVLEIVAGCVRYEAAKLAGLKAVPCIAMSLDSKAAEILKLHENIKRIPLDHIDQGETFIMMQDTFSMTEQNIADSVGKSIAYVSQHISLARLGDELTQSVKDGEISFSQGRILMQVKDKTQRLNFLMFCKNDGATVQVLSRWVQDYLRKPSNVSSSEPAAEEPRYEYHDPYITRPCDACDIQVEIKDLHNVLYCPQCHNAIKSAILSEKSNIIPDLPKNNS